MAEKSHAQVGFHSYTQEEKMAFTNFINNSIGATEYLVGAGYLPINAQDESIFTCCRDGEVLAYFLEFSVPGSIDPSKLLIRPKGGKALNPFQIQTNVSAVLKKLKDAGIALINIQTTDIIEGKPHLLFGIIWQLCKKGLDRQLQQEMEKQNKILLDMGIEVQGNQSPDKVILDFYNKKLLQSSSDKRIRTTNDCADVDVILSAFHVMYPTKVPSEKLALSKAEKAQICVEMAEQTGVPHTVSSEDLLGGNAKLGFLFAAQVAIHGLKQILPGDKFLLDWANDQTGKKAGNIGEVFEKDIVYELVKRKFPANAAKFKYAPANEKEYKATTTEQMLNECPIPRFIKSHHLMSKETIFIKHLLTQFFELGLPDDKTLLKWLNMHLEKQGTQISGFTGENFASGVNLAQVLANITDSKGFVQEVAGLTPDKAQTTLFGVLQKLSIQIPYPRQLVTYDDAQVQKHIFAQIYLVYPFILPPASHADDTLLKYIGFYLKQQKSKFQPNIIEDFLDMTSLSQCLSDVLSAQIPDAFEKLAPLEKARAVIDMSEKVQIKRQMTAENLAFGGRIYINNLLTSAYNIIQSQNKDHELAISLSKMVIEPSSDNLENIGLLISQLFPQVSTRNADSVEEKYIALSEALGQVGLEVHLNESTDLNAVVLHILMESIGEDEYILQRVGQVIQKRVTDVNIQDIETFMKKTYEISSAGSQIISAVFEKIFAKQPSTDLVNEIIKRPGGFVSKFLLFNTLQINSQVVDDNAQFIDWGFKRFIRTLETKAEDLVLAKEKEVQLLIQTPGEYQKIIAFICDQSSEKFDLSEPTKQSAKSLLNSEINIDHEAKLLGMPAEKLEEKMYPVALFHVMMNKLHVKPSYTLKQTAHVWDQAIQRNNQTVINATDFTDMQLVSWTQKNLQKQGFSGSMPNSIVLCADVLLPLINHAHIDIYPKELFSSLTSIFTKGHEDETISPFITEERLSQKEYSVIKIALREMYKPIDKVQERIFISNDILIIEVQKLVNRIITKVENPDRVGERQKQALSLNYLSSNPIDPNEFLTLSGSADKIAAFITNQINGAIGNPYCDAKKLMEGDEIMATAVWNDIILRDLLPVDLLLADLPTDREYTLTDPATFINAFCRSLTKDARDKAFLDAPDKQFQLVKATCEKIKVKFPFMKLDDLSMADPRFAQLVLTQIMEIEMYSIAELEQFAANKLRSKRFSSGAFNANNRKAEIKFDDPQLFTAEMIPMFLQAGKPLPRDISEDEKISRGLMQCEKAGIIVSMIKPHDILANDTRKIRMLLHQMYHEIDTTAGLKLVDVGLIEQQVTHIMQNAIKYDAQVLRAQPALRQFMQQYSQFKMEDLQDGKKFGAVVNILKPDAKAEFLLKELTTDDQQVDFYEGVLQALQNSAVDTLFCIPYDLMKLKDKSKVTLLLSQLVIPAEGECQSICGDFTKFMSRAEEPATISQVTAVQQKTVFPVVMNQMYPSFDKVAFLSADSDGQVAYINKFLQEQKVPFTYTDDLITDQFKLFARLCFIPYDEVDDFMISDFTQFQNVKLTLNDLLETLVKVSGLTLEGENDLEKLLNGLNRLGIPMFFDKDKITKEDTKTLFALLDQINMSGSLSIDRLIAASNNIFNQTGSQTRFINPNDIKKIEILIEMAEISYPKMGFLELLVSENKISDFANLLSKNNIVSILPKVIETKEVKILTYILNKLLLVAIQPPDLISWINSLLKKSQSYNQRGIKEVKEVNTPQMIATVLSTLLPEKYPSSILSQAGLISVQLEQFMENDNNLVNKLTAQQISECHIDRLMILFDEIYAPVDAASDLRILPTASLKKWVNLKLKEISNDKQIENLGKDLSDSEIYVLLLKQLDPQTFGLPWVGDVAAKLSAIVSKLNEAIPESSFIQSRDIEKGNARYNSALLTMLFEKYQFKHDPEDQQLIQWTNTMLNFQSHTKRKLQEFDDLQDGKIIAALLSVITHKPEIYRNFEKEDGSDKGFKVLINLLESNGLPMYLLPTDFTENNQIYIKQILNQLFSPINNIIADLVIPEAQLLTWIQHSTGLDDNSLYIDEMEQCYSLDNLYSILQQIRPDMVPASDDHRAAVSGLVTMLFENGYCPDVTMVEIESLNNWAACQRVLGTLREWDKVPSQHLINFMNKTNEDDPHVSSLDSQLSDSIALVKLINHIEPEVCDLRPLDIQDKIKRAQMLVEYLERIGFENIITAEDIVNGDEAKLSFVVEQIYKYQIQEDQEFVDFINNRLVKLGMDGVTTIEDFRLPQLALLLQQMHPDKMGDVSVLSQEDQLKKCLEVLSDEHNCNYIQGDILLRGDMQPIKLIVDVLFEPVVDFGSLPTLPVPAIEWSLKRTLDPQYAADLATPFAYQSYTSALISTAKPDFYFEDKQDNLYLEQLEKIQNAVKNVHFVDNYDFINNEQARVYLCNEIVLHDCLNEKEALEFANDMRNKMNPAGKAVNSLTDLSDCNLILQALVAANLTDKSALNVPGHDKKAKANKTTEILTSHGVNYAADPSDYKNPMYQRLILTEIDNLIRGSRPVLSSKDIIDWLAKKGKDFEVFADVNNIHQIKLTQPEVISALSKVLCASPKGIELKQDPVLVEDPNILDIFLNQCFVHGICATVFAGDIRNNDENAILSLLSDIYAIDIPNNQELIAIVNSILAGQQLQGINKVEQLDPLMTAVIINSLDPETQGDEINDPFATLNKGIKRMGAGTYFRPDDLQDPEKLKAIIKTARDKAGDADLDYCQILLDAAQAFNDGTLTIPAVISLQNIRDSCMLVKFMERIDPECFVGQQIRDKPQTPEQKRAWPLNKVINHSICLKVLRERFQLDPGCVSGRDLVEGDPKYIGCIIWMLAEREKSRITQDAFDVCQQLSELCGVMDLTPDNCVEWLVKCFEAVSPGMLKLTEEQKSNENSTAQMLLDTLRGCGLLVFARVPDLVGRNMDIVAEIAAQIYEAHCYRCNR